MPRETSAMLGLAKTGITGCAPNPAAVVVTVPAGAPMAEDETQAGSPFWRFSLRFYRQPGVADACIALQDGCGVDVNLLLFCLWLATARRCVSPDVAQAVCAKAAPWRGDVVTPLRAVPSPPKDGAAP